MAFFLKRAFKVLPFPKNPTSRSLSVSRPYLQEESGNYSDNEESRVPPTMMSNLLEIGSRTIFTPDHDMFRESVRRFVTEELAPAQKGFAETGEPSREIWERMGENGFLGVCVSAEVGGVGGSFKDEVIVCEEMSYANCCSPAVAVHSTIVMNYIANYGTKAQQETYIAPMAAGKVVGAIAMTEPDAGSDLQGIRTSAVEDGDDYVINGSKTFITNGWLADVCIVVAITDRDARSKAHGITLFVVDCDTPGFKKGKKLKKLGLTQQDTAELFFEDMRVHKSCILGGENSKNRGFYKLMNELPQERLAIAAHSAAHCEWMFEETRTYIRNRRAFGKTLADLQTVRHKMAELKTQIGVTRAFIDQCIELHDVGKLDGEMASMAKYWATDMENKVAGECLQLHGGWGFMMETPIAQAYADARVQTIYGGTNEIMKELIARNIVQDKR